MPNAHIRENSTTYSKLIVINKNQMRNLYVYNFDKILTTKIFFVMPISYVSKYSMKHDLIVEKKKNMEDISTSIDII